MPRLKNPKSEIHHCQQKWESHLRLTRKRSTYRRYANVMKGFFSAFPRKHMLGHFLPRDVEAYLKKRMATGLKPVSLRSELSVIRNFWEFTVDWGAFGTPVFNIARRVKIHAKIAERDLQGDEVKSVAS